MATADFERYVGSWAPEIRNGNHLQLVHPRTLLSGVPKVRREEAEIERLFDMPIDDLREEIRGINTKLDLLVRQSGNQEELNKQAERNRAAIEGEHGILVRLKSLEDSRKWSDFIMQSTIGALVATLIATLVAYFRK